MAKKRQIAKTKTQALAPNPATTGPSRSLTFLVGTIAAAIITSSIVYSLTGSHLALGFDEGIYIAGAKRLGIGQHLYRDFFEITGPGTFWLFAVWLKLFSPTLAAAHVLLAIGASIIAACVFVISAKHAIKLAAAATAAASIGLMVGFAHRLYVNHRWDSATCAALSVAIISLGPTRRKLAARSGLFAGLAIVFTPPTLLVGLAIVGCLFANRGTRKQSVLFAGAMLVPLTISAAVLAGEGSLLPLLHNLLWVSQHYSQANRVSYGFVPPDLAAESNTSPFNLAMMHLPTLLPLLSIALAGMLIWKKKHFGPTLGIVLAAGLTLAASCYPRVANNNLLFASPLLIAFLFAAGAQLMDAKAFRLLSSVALAIFLASTIFSLDTGSQYAPQSTQLGNIECRLRDLPNVQFAIAAISPGETLFVYPYQPIWYSLTGGVNPTSHDFMQPGMMTLTDESKVLHELEANPPQWVIWHNLSPQTVLAIWPHSDPATLHFNQIEHYLRSRYSQLKPPEPNHKYGIAIFHRIGSQQN